MAQSDEANTSIDTLTAEISQLRERIEAQHERLMEIQSFGARQSQFLIWFAGLAVVLLFVIAWRVDAPSSASKIVPYTSMVTGQAGGSQALAMEAGGLKTGSSGLPSPTASGLPAQQRANQSQTGQGQQQSQHNTTLSVYTSYVALPPNFLEVPRGS